MSTQPLPVSDFVQVSVSVSSGGVANKLFNQGLLVGDSAVIPSTGGVNPRLRQYSGGGSVALAAMLTDGFTDSDPEYIAAQMYFGADSDPYSVWIGRQDLTAIQTAVPAGRKVTDGTITEGTANFSSATAAFTSGDVGAAIIVAGAGVGGADLVTTIETYTSATAVVLSADASTTVAGATTFIGAYGHGYKVGDIVGVTQGGASGGFLTVLTIGADGQVETLGTQVGTQGTGYTVGNNLATTGGSGAGLMVDITAVGETFLQAVQACVAAAGANQSFYAFTCLGADEADHLALAAYSNANWLNVLYVGTTNDTGIPNATANNTALQIQALQYKACLVYSTTQGGLYPNNAYSAAAVIGEACGLTTMTAASYFTLNLKPIAGVGPEVLTQTQFANIKLANCNVVGSWGAYTGKLSPGILSSGDYYDQIMNRAALVNVIQTNLMNLLTSTPSIPQTNPGEAMLLHQVDLACQQFVSIGYLAPGTWEGATITFPSGTAGITNGQPMPLGYLDFADSYINQSPSDKAARKAMPIYSCINEAGAVQSVGVQVNVQL